MAQIGNRQDFLEWLGEMGEEYVGVPGSPCNCPYANYVKYLNGMPSDSNDISVAVPDPVNNMPGTVYVDLFGPFSSIPVETVALIDEIDRRSPINSTGNDVLRALERII